MVSDDKSKELSKEVLSEDRSKLNVKKLVSVERSRLASEEAKWSQEPTEFDRYPAHEKPFSIEPFPHERQRLPFKMTDEDRMRRKIWVQSQELTEREPVRVPELERMIYNPIRRLYRLPTDRLFSTLTPFIGEHRVPFVRYIVPKFFLGYIFGCVLYYNIKYNNPDWEQRHKGITLLKGREVYLPEEEKPKQLKKWEYADRGFASRKVFKGSEYAY